MFGATRVSRRAYAEAQRLVQSGAIGRPLTALDAMSITHAFTLPWYRDRDIAGGGVFMCNAVHGFDRVGRKIEEIVKSATDKTVLRTDEGARTILWPKDANPDRPIDFRWAAHRAVACVVLAIAP